MGESALGTSNSYSFLLQERIWFCIEFRYFGLVELKFLSGPLWQNKLDETVASFLILEKVTKRETARNWRDGVGIRTVVLSIDLGS